jgi:hypothetical protein
MANLTIPPWLLAIRKALGKLTDLLILGRQGGLWNQGKGPDIKPPKGGIR